MQYVSTELMKHNNKFTPPPWKVIIKIKLAETKKVQNKVILEAAIISPLVCKMYCTQMH